MRQWYKLRSQAAPALRAALAAFGPTAAAQKQPFELKDGETVVFYGDSITAQRYHIHLRHPYADGARILPSL